MFGIRKKEESGKTYFKNDWIEFHPRFHKANITLESPGYFDVRPQISCTLTTVFGFLGLLISPFIGFYFAIAMLVLIIFIPWGEMYLNLPYDTGRGDDCNSPRFGFYFYGEGVKIPDNLVICKGKKTIFLELPWCLDWVRTSNKKKNGEWLSEKSGDRKKGKSIDWYAENIADQLFKETHKYTYTLSNGEVQNVNATISIRQLEWRPKWFKWTKLFSKISTRLEVEFDSEVGERSGSWKGGTIGCSYEKNNNETPIECLRRMEKERKF